MFTHSVKRTSHTGLATGRAVQAGWLLFMLVALSLVLPTAIAIYSQVLPTVCVGTACLIGQLTATEMQAALAAGFRASDYASTAIISFLFSDALVILSAAALIWRKPTQAAAVCGSIALAAVSIYPLAKAAAAGNPALELPARIIQLVPWIAFPYCFCLMPDGHFHSRWLRWFCMAVVPASVLVVLGAAGGEAGLILSIMVGVLSLGAVLHRYRSLTALPQHEQVTWALAGLILLAGAQWIGRPIQPLPQATLPVDLFPTIFFMFAPLLGMLMVVGALTCLTVALLSDELFRIEVALNRALVYSVLTLFVVGSYVLIVGYLSQIFQSNGSLWFSLVATGLVAVLFQSIRERVQRFVNRLLYGDRDEPYVALARLGQRLEAAFEPATILPSIVETVARTLNLPYVAIATVEHGGLNVKSEWRAPDGQSLVLDAPLLTIPLIYQNEPLGELRASPRRGEATLAEVDRRLLSDLAQQASAAVHGVRLMDDLRDLSIDLQASRERMVLAREEERRRLRRDLHDDLAPTLAGLALTASTIADRIPADPGKAVALANDLNTAIRATIGDIRRLVDDLRPPSLDQLGLVAALRERAAQFSLAGNGLCVTVEADELPPLPAAIEVAAYRIAQEALMNAIRHAQAHTCGIRLTVVDARLLLEISDDGVGLSKARTAGLGLNSMQERAGELGGLCLVESAPQGGTCVRASLPIARPDAL